ncbi:MAG: helix-turn-helix domain-containing protein [Pedobacter sp.]|nr:MAG: helix-turn-helix domain-containing protein [Pedobacter sp.]
MQKQKIFFAGNIKLLRERKKMSQEALALELNISRAKLAAIELGQTKSPQPEDYINVSNYFNISIDNLLKDDLTKLAEIKLKQLELRNDDYLAGDNIRILAITVDGQNRENVEYVPVKAKAGYKAGYSDPEYIANLPKYSFPDLPKDGTYRMFPTIGDSMLPIPEGSDIVAKYVQDWKSIQSETPCIVVLKGDQDFIFKKVTLQDNGTILLRSFNESYQAFTEPIENVLEIWVYQKYVSNSIPIDIANDLNSLRKLVVNLHTLLIPSHDRTNNAKTIKQ